MTRLTIVFFILFFQAETYSQTDVLVEANVNKTYFSEQIYRYYATFKEKSNRAFSLGNREEAHFYYQELVEKHLVGSFMDNFNTQCLSSNQCEIQDFERPLVLLTYASWNVPTKGEIPALNSIAKKYKDEIDFAVIFWDEKKDVREAAKNYHKLIQILYVDELKNRDAHTVKMLKHSLGFPTIFVVASNKEIIKIERNHQNSYGIEDEIALKECLSRFNDLVKEVQDFEKTLISRVSG